MDSSSVQNALAETRQHAATIAGHVGDFRAKLDQFEHTVAARFAAIQHAQQELLQHLQAERDRARSENDGLLQAFHEATDWLHQTGTTLATDSKALADDLAAAENGAHAGSTTLQQATEHLAQLTTTANQHFGTVGQQAQADVDHAHDQVHEQMVATLTATQEQVHSAAAQHQSAISQALHGEFHGHQTEFHTQAEHLATQAAHTMHDRADRLHTDIAHEVDSLHQHQDQHHTDLAHKLDSVKNDLTHLGSTLTDTAHGLGDTVDTASVALQATNVGVEEILKIIQNIESVFQSIISEMH